MVVYRGYVEDYVYVFEKRVVALWCFGPFGWGFATEPLIVDVAWGIESDA